MFTSKIRFPALCTFGLLLMFTIHLHAGGTSYMTEITSFSETSQDRYRMEIIQHLPAASGSFNQVKRIIRLRYNSFYYQNNVRWYASLAKYREAIEILRAHALKQDKFKLGNMGSTFLIPVEGKTNEYWVQTIALIEEYDGTKVVYMFKE